MHVYVELLRVCRLELHFEKLIVIIWLVLLQTG